MFEETKPPANSDSTSDNLSNDRGDPGNHPEDHPADESVIDRQADDAQGRGGPPEAKVELLRERLRLLAQAYMSQTNRLESQLQIVTACQKETAEFANHVVERHALHPAVETVDFLTTLIRQLTEQAASLVEGRAHCPVFQPLFNSIADAAKMAQAKREYLDMEAICPQPLEDLDVEKDEIRQVVQTDDPGKHKRVERTLIPGLIYRGSVLRRAKISIYRHVEKEQ